MRDTLVPGLEHRFSERVPEDEMGIHVRLEEVDGRTAASVLRR